ncbi:hypothetical protein B0T44_14465 [Nocardia donostiensis]|uniref:Uncharacterized protein n=1 Tax=Nocardia donostiensis TaxID=1538463 RepID=A0A1W0BA27_9NOCA|nr:hypothetical protein B0T46_02730 [Nocardia donostiensis]OQS19402.1 hypothetical protein B0T44_14465 [Nocardia donostiensis]
MWRSADSHITQVGTLRTGQRTDGEPYDRIVAGHLTTTRDLRAEEPPFIARCAYCTSGPKAGIDVDSCLTSPHLLFALSVPVADHIIRVRRS